MIRLRFVANEELPSAGSSSITDDDGLAWQVKLGPLSLQNIIPDPNAWDAGEGSNIVAFDDEAPINLPRLALWSQPRIWIDSEDFVLASFAQDEGWKLARPSVPSINRFTLATESDVFLGSAPPPVGPAQRHVNLHIGTGLGVR